MGMNRTGSRGLIVLRNAQAPPGPAQLIQRGDRIASWEYVPERGSGPGDYKEAADITLLVQYEDQVIADWDGGGFPQAPASVVIETGGVVNLRTPPAVIVPRVGMAYHVVAPLGRAFSIPTPGAVGIGITPEAPPFGILAQVLPGKPVRRYQPFFATVAIGLEFTDQVPSYAQRVRVYSAGGAWELRFRDGSGTDVQGLSVLNGAGLGTSGPIPIPTNAKSWAVTNVAGFEQLIAVEFETWQ